MALKRGLQKTGCAFEAHIELEELFNEYLHTDCHRGPLLDVRAVIGTEYLHRPSLVAIARSDLSVKWKIRIYLTRSALRNDPPSVLKNIPELHRDLRRILHRIIRYILSFPH